jgi:hypothetical protein
MALVEIFRQELELILNLPVSSHQHLGETDNISLVIAVALYRFFVFSVSFKKAA